jgi:hypothetical protein
MNGVTEKHDEEPDERSDRAYGPEPKTEYHGFPVWQLVMSSIVGTNALVFYAGIDGLSGIFGLIGGTGLVLTVIRDLVRRVRFARQRLA